jgi:hypothetical protein
MEKSERRRPDEKPAHTFDLRPMRWRYAQDELFGDWELP